MNDHEKSCSNLARQVLAVAMLLMILAQLMPVSHAEQLWDDPDAAYEFDFDDGDWDDAFVILDDPEYFMFEDDEEYWEDLFTQDDSDLEYEEELLDDELALIEEAKVVIPTISSIGKTNVKVAGVKSSNKLLPYTIPEKYLSADPNFLALMIEAEKYIGYPYVYGESNPKNGFDCSGFVSWVYIHSGVYNTGRRGANGLHSLCREITAEELRPGDLIFFQKTMGPEVKGITHVGIFVGDHYMIHAGDPVGFADLHDEKWVKRFYCYGRLPID